MAVKIRMTRMGSKKKPVYRIVAIDSRKARGSAYLENLGTYDPLVDPAKAILKKDEIISWLNKGAQPSQTVKDILKKEGVWSRFKGKAAPATVKVEKSDSSAETTEGVEEKVA